MRVKYCVCACLYVNNALHVAIDRSVQIYKIMRACVCVNHAQIFSYTGPVSCARVTWLYASACVCVYIRARVCTINACTCARVRVCVYVYRLTHGLLADKTYCKCRYRSILQAYIKRLHCMYVDWADIPN